MRLRFALVLVWILCFSGSGHRQDWRSLKINFIKGFTALNVPEIEYDYRRSLASIPDTTALRLQLNFFNHQEQTILSVDTSTLSAEERIERLHILYEIAFNKFRVNLEQHWVQEGRPIPEGGISQLPNVKNWYRYLITRYTTLSLSPETVMDYGRSEVQRVQQEILAIRIRLGFTDSASFYKHLASKTFGINTKQALIDRFATTDSLVRTYLPQFISVKDLPKIYPMEWPDAGPNTPPGIYLNQRNTAYGKDVFQFNFYNNSFNSRAVDWLYLHEAIPGHHLQSSLREPDQLCDLFFYPGNFEGWACYVEYFGKDLGVYRDAYAELGKWEWDLVRSARLVLDVGIHYYGWTREEALNYWKVTIPGQDAIAEREVTRVTNWCGQALSYKIGAKAIMEMRSAWLAGNPSRPPRDFHTCFIAAGLRPLPVIAQQLKTSMPC